jgi:hypothetical protein
MATKDCVIVYTNIYIVLYYYFPFFFPSSGTCFSQQSTTLRHVAGTLLATNFVASVDCYHVYVVLVGYGRRLDGRKTKMVGKIKLFKRRTRHRLQEQLHFRVTEPTRQHRIVTYQLSDLLSKDANPPLPLHAHEVD